MNEGEPPEEKRPDGSSSLPSPDEVRRSLHWSERWRAKFSQNSRLRRGYDSLFPPISEPTSFTEPHDELVERLMPRDADGQLDKQRTVDVLAEAQAIFAAEQARIEGAERRATTLQGAVAIATSLLLAGGTLLADPSTVRGDGWRAAFAAALVAVVLCLVAAGGRALASTSRIHVFHAPTPVDILRRSGIPGHVARIELAAETLKDYGYNAQVANWKVAHLRAAAEWFSRALVALLLLAVLLAAYGVLGPDVPSTEPAMQANSTEAN